MEGLWAAALVRAFDAMQLSLAWHKHSSHSAEPTAAARYSAAPHSIAVIDGRMAAERQCAVCAYLRFYHSQPPSTASSAPSQPFFNPSQRCSAHQSLSSLLPLARFRSLSSRFLDAAAATAASATAAASASPLLLRPDRVVGLFPLFSAVGCSRSRPAVRRSLSRRCPSPHTAPCKRCCRHVGPSLHRSSAPSRLSRRSQPLFLDCHCLLVIVVHRSGQVVVVLVVVVLVFVRGQPDYVSMVVQRQLRRRAGCAGGVEHHSLWLSRLRRQLSQDQRINQQRISLRLSAAAVQRYAKPVPELSARHSYWHQHGHHLSGWRGDRYHRYQRQRAVH